MRKSRRPTLSKIDKNEKLIFYIIADLRTKVFELAKIAQQIIFNPNR